MYNQRIFEHKIEHNIYLTRNRKKNKTSDKRMWEKNGIQKKYYKTYNCKQNGPHSLVIFSRHPVF